MDLWKELLCRYNTILYVAVYLGVADSLSVEGGEDDGARSQDTATGEDNEYSQTMSRCICVPQTCHDETHYCHHSELSLLEVYITENRAIKVVQIWLTDSFSIHGAVQVWADIKRRVKRGLHRPASVQNRQPPRRTVKSRQVSGFVSLRVDRMGYPIAEVSRDVVFAKRIWTTGKVACVAL